MQLDRQRVRTPLDELRQVAEAALLDRQLQDEVQLVSTDCLGPCGNGHVMGYSRPGQDLLMFTQMNDPERVRDLVEVAASDRPGSTRKIPDSLRTRLEAVLDDESRKELPVKAVIPVTGGAPHDA